MSHHHDSFDDDDAEELNECPLCTEEFDVTDKNFKPCRCGYQICIWCWHKLMETAGGRCPNCRRIYDSNNLDFTPPDPNLIQTEKKKQVKKRHIFSRKQLVNVRVIQRNLVYVVGLTMDVAREDVGWLRKAENFGKYGKIVKVVINKSNLSSGLRPPNVRSPTVSAYITYARKEDAYKCIKAIDSTWLDSKLLRASFGTTKYCAYFLRGIPCTNPDCMYLHDYGDEEDTFNKEDIVLRNGLPVPHNSAKLSQFYPHLDDPTPCEKHYWNFKDSNVAPPDAGEDVYDDDYIDEYRHYQHHQQHHDDDIDDIDAHDEDEYGEEIHQWASSSDEPDEAEVEPPSQVVNEYAKDPSQLDQNGSILPSTAKWGKKSPEPKKNKKKKNKKNANKLPQPVVAPAVPLDANNAWSTANKIKAPVNSTTSSTTTTTSVSTTITTTITTPPLKAKKKSTTPPEVPKPQTVVAQPPPQSSSQPPSSQSTKKPSTTTLTPSTKQEETKKKKSEEEEEEDQAEIPEHSEEDDSIIRESPLTVDLDLPIEQEFVFSEHDQIHDPIPIAPLISDTFKQQPDPVFHPPPHHNTASALWSNGVASLPPQQQQQQQHVLPPPHHQPQPPQTQPPHQPPFASNNSFVHSLMQFGLGGNELASQLHQQSHMLHHQQQQQMHQQQYLHHLYQPTPPDAIDLGDLPWESTPFIEKPTRTNRSRFEFAQFGRQQSFGDAWTGKQENSWGKSFETTTTAAAAATSTSNNKNNAADLQESFRALLPNVNISFSSSGMNNNDTWSSNMSQTGQNISINNNINNINININNHHHAQGGFSGFAPMSNVNNENANNFFGNNNPFTSDAWSFQPPTFASHQDPIFLANGASEPVQSTVTSVTQESKTVTTNTTTAASKKGKTKKNKGKN